MPPVVAHFKPNITMLNQHITIDYLELCLAYQKAQNQRF